MKTLTLIISLFVCVTLNGQYNKYKNMYIPGLTVGATFLAVNSMNLPYKYEFNPRMQYVRDRQRFTVAITGILITTGVTYLIQRHNKKHSKY